MKATALVLAPFLVCAPVAAQAPDFNGSFSAAGQNGTVTVTLKAADSERYIGTMSNGTLTWRIDGELEDDALVGTVNTGQVVLGFEAHIEGARLRLILAEVGADGIPRLDKAGELVLARTQAPLAASGPAAHANVGASPSTPGVVLADLTTQYSLRRTASVGGVAGGTAGAGAAAAGSSPAGRADPLQVDSSPLSRQWRDRLAGSKVTCISSYSSSTLGGGGYSTKHVYHLCSDGRFAYSGSDVVSLNAPGTGINGGGSAGSSSGSWRIVTEGHVAGIELRFANGQTELYRLDARGGKTFANGNQVYVTPGEVCR